MRSRRALSLALIAAAQPAVWILAVTEHSGESSIASPLMAAAVVAPAHDPAPAPTDEGQSILRIFESTLEFIREVSKSFESGDYAGTVIRLLIIVEVLIGALGIVSCVTVWGQGKADLVYRIVDVMGALFLFITLLLLATLAIRGQLRTFAVSPTTRSALGSPSPSQRAHNMTVGVALG